MVRKTPKTPYFLDRNVDGVGACSHPCPREGSQLRFSLSGKRAFCWTEFMAPGANTRASYGIKPHSHRRHQKAECEDPSD